MENSQNPSRQQVLKRQAQVLQLNMDCGPRRAVAL